jgi:hypothetical protein
VVPDHDAAGGRAAEALLVAGLEAGLADHVARPAVVELLELLGRDGSDGAEQRSRKPAALGERCFAGHREAAGDVVEPGLDALVVGGAQRDRLDELLRAGAADRAGDGAAVDVHDIGERGHGRADVLDLVPCEPDAVDGPGPDQGPLVTIDDVAALRRLAGGPEAPIGPELGVDGLRRPRDMPFVVGPP